MYQKGSISLTIHSLTQTKLELHESVMSITSAQSAQFSPEGRRRMEGKVGILPQLHIGSVNEIQKMFTPFICLTTSPQLASLIGVTTNNDSIIVDSAFVNQLERRIAFIERWNRTHDLGFVTKTP